MAMLRHPGNHGIMFSFMLLEGVCELYFAYEQTSS